MPTKTQLLALAEAERELRRRNAAASPPREDEQSFLEIVGGVAGEINTGILSYIPGARDFLAPYGISYPSGQEPQGPLAAGARALGMAAPLALGIPFQGARLLAGAVSEGLVLGQAGVMRGMVTDIAKTASANPGLFYSAEAASAFASGALGESARESGASEGQVLAAEVFGGLAGGILTTALPRSAAAFRDSIRTNLLPMTEIGGTIRAAKQLQQRAGGADQAAEYAKTLVTLPEGITPAQWIGDERLMAQEARLLADNPQLSNQVKGELEEARMIAQENVADFFGRPRSRQDWELSVLNRVTPEGAVIKRAPTDEMLDQAYASFQPLYDQAKGFDIPVGNLRNSLIVAVRDENIIADPVQRQSIEKWVANQYKAYSPKVSEGSMSSEDLLDLRSKIRSERRKQSKAGNLVQADLLGSAEAEITTTLNKGLPEEVIQVLGQADSDYRTYKIVEDAIYHAGDEILTPQQLSNSIRSGGLSTQSQYARGVNETTQELRQLALAGRSTEELLGDPERAVQMVRGLDDKAKKAVQADFINVLYNRARGSALEATEAGVPFISGRKLLQDLTANKKVLNNIGTSEKDMEMLMTIAENIRAMEGKSPAAVAQLFEDGPANILQLVAALAGAKSGQRIAGQGMGSSLVMAQFMSNKARGTLVRLTSDAAAQIMKDAVTDPKLYKALLLKKTGSLAIQKASARYVEAWLLTNAAARAAEIVAPSNEKVQK